MAEQVSINQELEQLLSSLGLTEKEAKTYRILLETGTNSIGIIVSKTGLKRGITYACLYALEKLGLVRKFEKDKKTFFEPLPPEKLSEICESKSKEIELTKAKLDHLLPKLSKQYKLSIGKPTIQYFEGKDGLVKVFQDIYAPKQEPVYGAVDVEQIEKVFSGLSLGKLVPSRIENKLEVKCLYNDTPLGRTLEKNAKKELRECILLDPEKYPLPAEIEAYEDKVALMSFKQGEFLGMIIQNEDFAITLRSILKFLFDSRKVIKPKD